MFRGSSPALNNGLPPSKSMIGRNKLEAIRNHDMFHNKAQLGKWASWRFAAAGFATYFAVKTVVNIVSPPDNHH